MKNIKEYKLLARQLRNNPTKAENRMWYEVLSQRKIKSYRFIRQKILFPFIVDFYCPKLRLIVEIDGKSHDYDDNNYDLNREKYLTSRGCYVLRFTDWEVFKQQDEIYKILCQEIGRIEVLQSCRK